MARVTPLRRRAIRLRPLGVAAGVALGALVLGALLAIASSWRPTVRTIRAPGSAALPDRLLVVTSRPGGDPANPPAGGLAVFEPGTSALRPVLDGALDEPLVAPDGRQV